MIRYAPKSPNLTGMDISVDFNNMMESQVGSEHGLSVSLIEKLDQDIRQPGGQHERIQKLRDEGKMGFAELPWDMETLSRIKDLAARIRGSFDNFVVLGIGGSALGAIAIHSALNHPQYNLLDPGDRSGCPRMFFCDNIDPDAMTNLLNLLDVERTIFNVISKSGSTVETVSQFLIIRDQLKKALGPKKMKDHIVVTTDPKNGDLRAICNDEDFEGLMIPPNVGGRFSCLTAVGLFPAAVSGIDVDGIIGGARSMDLRCRRQHLLENPAYLVAALNFLADRKFNKNILVMMPYANSLLRLTDWFCQLHAESLGKKGFGQTPIAALGATDQHSQLQLYLDGPNNKVINLISVERFRDEVPIPPTPQEYENFSSVSYLGGHSLEELFHTERLATESALAYNQRPNLTINFPALCSETVGQFIFQMEYQTVFAGFLYDVNPFDQPAVELGKKLTYHMMGRKGFEKKVPELINFKKKNQKFII